MRRRHLVTLLALGLLAPVAVSTPSGGAITQDLVVSATSGAPGTVIEVSSATCATPESPDIEIDDARILTVRLVASGPSGEALAGANTTLDGSTSLVVPDWVDADQPATIEARCLAFDPDDFDAPPSGEPFDPVAFDVVAGPGAPTQVRTASRTSLLVGQAFEVAAAGCSLDGAAYASLDLFAGDDPTLRTIEDQYAVGGTGDAPVGGAFTVRTDLVDRGFGFSWSSTNGGRPVVQELTEGDTDLAPGTYTGFVSCADDGFEEGAFLFYEPLTIEVSGRSGLDDVDLVVAPGTDEAVLAGGSCPAGDVAGIFEGIDLVREAGELPFLRVPEPSGSAAFPSGIVERLRTDARAPRSIDDQAVMDFTATTDDAGAWQVDDRASFDLGIVVGVAACGDPLADGFGYELQLAAVDVPPPAPTTTTTAPPTPAPGPPPAAPIAGSPTFAG